MMTFRSSAPRPTITCLSRSWVSGRENFTCASSIAMALASPGPIQIGSTRSPSRSWRMTTGVLVVRSRPRFATRTSSTRALGAEVPGAKIALLLRGEGVDGDAHPRELEARDLLVAVARQPVHVLAQMLRFPNHVLGGEGLIRERHVHHTRGVALGGGEIHEPAVGEHAEPLAVEPPLLHELADGRRPLGGLLQRVQVDFDVEVPRVRDHRTVLHGP